jgi:hypothetical protein
MFTESVPETQRPVLVEPVSVASVDEEVSDSACVEKCSTKSSRPSPFTSSNEA